jgi:hypothetical protein
MSDYVSLSKTRYSITDTVTNAGGLTASAAMVVNVTDISENFFDTCRFGEWKILAVMGKGRWAFLMDSPVLSTKYFTNLNSLKMFAHACLKIYKFVCLVYLYILYLN